MAKEYQYRAIFDFLRIPQRSESANHVARFGLWLLNKDCITGNEARLRELMVQYHIELKEIKDVEIYEKAIIPERLRGRVIGALTPLPAGLTR